MRYNTLQHNSGSSASLRRIIVHPGFDGWTNDNDIAILELSSPLNLNQPQTGAAQLPQSGNDPQSGLTVTASGWGRTDEFDATFPDNLKTVNVSIVAREKCRSQYEVLNITERMICAADESASNDVCQV